MACLKCVSEKCPWQIHRESLLRYWLECRQASKGFGDLGCVNAVVNKRARKVMCTKFNILIDKEVNAPVHECVVDGLSFLFPSEQHTDGTTLPELITHGERPKKKNKISIDININKNF